MRDPRAAARGRLTSAPTRPPRRSAAASARRIGGVWLESSWHVLSRQRTDDNRADKSRRRAHLCPGDIATDVVDARPQVPDADARAVMLTPADVARAVGFLLASPASVRVDELVLSPSATA